MATDEIPWDGLAEVLRGWSGRGQLYEALAAVQDDFAEVQWSPADIDQRAHRIMFEHLKPKLEAWPTNTDTWLNALPAESLRKRRLASEPRSGVDWVATRALGWPPEQFVVRERTRVASQMMSRILRWTIDQLVKIQRDAIRTQANQAEVAAKQIAAAVGLLRIPPLKITDGLQPSSAEIQALRTSGNPWTLLAPVAEYLGDLVEPDLLRLAREHLKPDDDISWRLFHLSILGVLLKSLHWRGARIVSKRPLSASVTRGPNYEVELDGIIWHLWFESAGAWDYYSVDSPYKTLIASAIGKSEANRDAKVRAPDILLLAPNRAALALECKYGKSKNIRDGYLQAVTYGHELRRYFAPNVYSYVVGPDAKIRDHADVTFDDWKVGYLGARHLRELELP